MLANPASARAHALPEFLLAIALNRLRLAREDIVAVQEHARRSLTGELACYEQLLVS
jgi:hypothetical protein